MAVPKKKTSQSRMKMRRSHHALKQINVVTDSETGEHRLSHHICKIHGTYNGKTVIAKKSDEENNNDES